ncbi:hypothetical protein KAT92_00665 [Candidatus Babeliales bacterium]|nr:hypothetical protein [Candidatus Babeliales bacterium]
MNKKYYVFTLALALATIAGTSQLASYPNAQPKPTIPRQQQETLAEQINRNARKIYDLEKALFSYNPNSSEEYIPQWEESEQFRDTLINDISLFISNNSGYNFLSDNSNYEEPPTVFYYRTQPGAQPQQTLIRRSKKHFLGLLLFTGIIESLPNATKRFILDEIDSLSPDLHAQLLSEYLLISNPDDFSYAANIPKTAASLYFRERQNQSRQPLFSNFLYPLLGKYNQLSTEEKADFLIVSCENLSSIEGNAIEEKLIPVIQNFIEIFTGHFWQLKPLEQFSFTAGVLQTDIGKTSLKTNLLKIIPNLLNAEESWTNETSTKADFLYSLISALDWKEEEYIHNLILNKMLECMDKNIVYENEVESKKNLLYITLKLKIWHKYSSWNFKTQFANWIHKYLEGDEYLNFLKIEKVELLSKIFKSKIWQSDSRLEDKLLSIILEYTNELPIALASWNQEETNSFEDASTNLNEPVDLEDDTDLIKAILESGFWSKHQEKLTEKLCNCCLALTKHEFYGDLLTPLLNSKLFESNQELAKKVALMAIEKFDSFTARNLPDLCRAQASLATRVIKSGIWKLSEELVEKLEIMCSQAIQGMEDDPIKDDEDDAILEMADDSIANNDEQRIEALLNSITKSEIWRYWIWS